MIEVSNIYDIPSVPAVYLMYSGKEIVYAGVSKDVKERLMQHLVKRDSSITTGASAVCLNPDYIDKVVWWEDESFKDNRDVLEAAELIAFDLFKPVIRSRSNPRNASKELYKNKEIKEIFSRGASGCLKIENFKTVLARVDKLEKKINELETIHNNGLVNWHEKNTRMSLKNYTDKVQSH